jgi:hypothetical protein
MAGFLRTLYDDKALGLAIIRKQEEIFEKQRQLFPGHDPHTWLAQVWLSWMAAGGKNPNDPALQMAAYAETGLFACLPIPDCATALGLYILYKERPYIIERHPEFAERYSRIMAPVFEATNNGMMGQLYRRRNPGMT